MNIGQLFKEFAIILLTFFFVILFLNPLLAQTKTDSVSFNKIGFKSLFTADKFNPDKPYLTQLSPKAVPFVQEYIRKQGKELEKMKGWGRPYFDLYNQILPQYGVPVELKYLSVIESHLQCRLVSWAGAVGPWQLMDYEAKRFGLKLKPIDERCDYNKSTHAAGKLLKELYNEFGDWLLVVAAYNGGAGRVRQAIRLSGSRDFWDLQQFLREETRTHVKKFIGTHYIFEGSGGLTTMTNAEVKEFKANAIINTNELLNDTSLAVIPIIGRYNSSIVANGLDLKTDYFNRLNTGFDKAMANGENYNLRIPKNKEPLFKEKKNELLQLSIQKILQDD